MYDFNLKTYCPYWHWMQDKVNLTKQNFWGEHFFGCTLLAGFSFLGPRFESQSHRVPWLGEFPCNPSVWEASRQTEFWGRILPLRLHYRIWPILRKQQFIVFLVDHSLQFELYVGQTNWPTPFLIISKATAGLFYAPPSVLDCKLPEEWGLRRLSTSLSLAQPRTHR